MVSIFIIINQYDIKKKFLFNPFLIFWLREIYIIITINLCRKFYQDTQNNINNNNFYFMKTTIKEREIEKNQKIIIFHSYKINSNLYVNKIIKFSMIIIYNKIY